MESGVTPRGSWEHPEGPHAACTRVVLTGLTGGGVEGVRTRLKAASKVCHLTNNHGVSAKFLWELEGGDPAKLLADIEGRARVLEIATPIGMDWELLGPPREAGKKGA